jgi:hypothetical protein
MVWQATRCRMDNNHFDQAATSSSAPKRLQAYITLQAMPCHALNRNARQRLYQIPTRLPRDTQTNDAHKSHKVPVCLSQSLCRSFS